MISCNFLILLLLNDLISCTSCNLVGFVVIELLDFFSGNILLNISPVLLANHAIRKLPWTGSVHILCGQQSKVNLQCSCESYLI